MNIIFLIKTVEYEEHVHYPTRDGLNVPVTPSYVQEVPYFDALFQLAYCPWQGFLIDQYDLNSP